MSDITIHTISTNRDTRCQLCPSAIDRGDVYVDLLTVAGLMRACQPCAEWLIPGLHDAILDPPAPMLP